MPSSNHTDFELKYVRIKALTGPKGLLPISRSSFYQGVKDGLYPKPIKLGRISVWSVAEIEALLKRRQSETVALAVADPS